MLTVLYVLYINIFIRFFVTEHQNSTASTAFSHSWVDIAKVVLCYVILRKLNNVGTLLK